LSGRIPSPVNIKVSNNVQIRVHKLAYSSFTGCRGRILEAYLSISRRLSALMYIFA